MKTKDLAALEAKAQAIYQDKRFAKVTDGDVTVVVENWRHNSPMGVFEHVRTSFQFKGRRISRAKLEATLSAKEAR